MKNKTKFCLVACLLILFNIIFAYKVEAKSKRLYVDARSAIAMSSKSKAVLYEKNSDMLIPIASTTKIMTSLVALKYGNLDMKIEISEKAANIHGSQVGYKKGEIITLRELLYGLMLRSGNDAAIAIAEGISGSVNEFLKLMNEYALQIGAINTHFESPHGLDSQYHYSTAYDLALITSKAKENEIFNKIVSSKYVDANEYGFTRSYHNINKILYQIPNANGVKTGYTGGAGKCLVSSIHDEKDDIIIVVLNSNKRWDETKKIYDHIKQNFKFKQIATKGETIDNIVCDRNKNIKLISSEDVIIPVAIEENLETKVIKPTKIPRKIDSETPLGRLCIYKNGSLIKTTVLMSKDNMDTKKHKNIKEIIKNFLKRS